MRTVKQLSELKKGSVLAIGTFDGIHIGHQSVLRTAVQLAQEQKVLSAVLTFANHPLSVIAPAKMPKEIISLKQKEKLLADLGFDVLVELNFDTVFANVTAADFINMVKDYSVVVGENFLFGKNLQGKGTDIPKAIIKKMVEVDGETVSSTRIRKNIVLGDMPTVQKLLGRNYVIEGKVIKGEQRGRILGYPTINLDFGNYEVPMYGAYVVKVWYKNSSYPAMANVGNNPTFGNTNHRLEVHILNFNQDIYGEDVAVEFLAKIRNEQKFATAAELKEQLKKDKIYTCEYFVKVVS